MAVKDVYILNTLDEVNLVSDPIRLDILLHLGTTPKTAQDVADALGVSRSKIHYHLKILEDAGIIEVVKTELINGITQKYFLPVAKAFIPNTGLFSNAKRKKSFSIALAPEMVADFERELDQLVRKYQSEVLHPVPYQLEVYQVE
uniref:ArsR/SmtB family transcription factor n=1 Tax=Ndongobacter massiliensis TaxID=1871025 RepID=UPI000AFD5B5A|nr:helix-turn-helix domain-containing protein [Ndongobacter massiliensis]